MRREFHGGLREVGGEGKRDAKINEDRPSGARRREESERGFSFKLIYHHQDTCYEGG